MAKIPGRRRPPIDYRAVMTRAGVPFRIPSVDSLWSSEDAADQQLLHMLAVSTNDGIWDWDLTSDRVYYSPRWLEFVGEEPGALDYHIDTFMNRLHPDDVAGMRGMLDAFIIGAIDDYRLEFRLRHRDGSWRWILSRGAALRDEDGRAFRIVGTHTDVTDRIEAAERLERLVAERTADLRAARDRAELAAAATAKFLAATSHDIRQPLQAMALLLGGLHRQVNGEAGRKTLRAVERSLIASMELLDSLLEYSRLDAGALRPSVGAARLDDVIESAVSAFQAEAAQKGIAIRIVPTGAIVRTDPQLLGRIVRNLVSNAIKYTAEGRVLIGCRRVGGRTRLEIWDTGCGIADDRQRQIFWEFVQLREGRAGGLGLGLAIVDRLARLLGHEIGLRSSPGHGSVFSVTMENRPPAQAARHELMPDEAMWLGPLRIALLEDHGAIADALCQLLASWGCIVIHAVEPGALIAALGATAPDLMLADWHLANGADGFVAFCSIEAHYGIALPGVILTGDYDFDALEAANGARRTVLHKPVLPKILHAVLQAQLNRP